MEPNRSDKLEYYARQRARAGTAATFRGIAAAYIAYLGYRLIRGELDGSSTLPPWAGWLTGILFIAAALGFGYYIWKRWRADVEAARITDTNNEEDAPED